MQLLKLKLKRLLRFCSRGGLSYISFSSLVGSFTRYFRGRQRTNSTRTIYWIGPFSPIHANVGDHAQTLGVQKYLKDEFEDHRIIKIFRDSISAKKLSNMASKLRASDLVFLHSSGDFGSLHDVPSHHTGRLSFPEIRRQLVTKSPVCKVINLPTTAFYGNNESAKISLNRDRDVFSGSRLTVLCREEMSLRVLRENLSCESRFFPDFVFYLKPKPFIVEREGALVILRNDKEALLAEVQKQDVVEALRKSYSEVELKDIMHASHTIPDFILENYMDNVFRQFQKRELIVTDKMHGMITAVITRTPCIALSGGIPHKIKAYKPFLSGAVQFIEHVCEIEDAVQYIRNSEYAPVDLSEYFDRFREEVTGV
jgi:pyruvyl transferase EpsI